MFRYQLQVKMEIAIAAFGLLSDDVLQFKFYQPYFLFHPNRIVHRTMKTRLNLYDFDITAVLSCYEYVCRHETNCGSVWFSTRLRQELKLVLKLENRVGRAICFTDREIEIMYSWMERTILCKYGDATLLFGYERRIYTILKSKQGISA